MDEMELRTELSHYKFYHIIPLTDELSTPGNPKNLPIQKLVQDAMMQVEFRGKRVLDIGCRDGLFSFQSEKMGAAEVIGIDNDLSKPAVEFLIPYFNSSVHMVEMNLFHLAPDQFGLFDIVIFAGVLYHLRYPFWALKLVKDIMPKGGILILETAVWRGDGRYAMLYCPVGVESPYEPTSCTFFNPKGLVDTLQSLGIQVIGMRYLSDQESRGKTLLRRLKRKFISLSKLRHGSWVKDSVDRLTLVCKVSEQLPDQVVQEYWNDLHKIHTLHG